MAPAAEAPLSVLLGITVWFTPPTAGVSVSRFVSVRPGPRGPLVCFEGVDSIDTAKRLVGAQVLAKTDDLPDTWVDEPEDEGVEGFAVTDEVHGLLGVVVETIVTGANDVWVVHGPVGEILIPVIDDVVLGIDESERTIDVRLLDGLMPGED